MFVDGTNLCPPEFIIAAGNSLSKESNPRFYEWVNKIKMSCVGSMLDYQKEYWHMSFVYPLLERFRLLWKCGSLLCLDHRSLD